MQRKRFMIGWGMLLGLSLPLVFAGCATTSEEEEGPLRRTHYTIRPGDPIPHRWPLPAEHPVYIDWHYTDSSVQPTKGFRGWDFNSDGLFDMLEVLNADGEVQISAYDFDHDGIIDETIYY